ncbi:MAG: hypothetical protein N2646_08440, partial [Bellilinea sp.]|nr:hypothetical protein [Bellilinea sp.]
QSSDDIEIFFPTNQQVLQGIIEIQGRITLPDMRSYELLFGYSNDPDERNLFLLAQGNTLPDGQLTFAWDTTLIPDGDYRLVWRVYLSSGEKREAVIEMVRVRNYSIVETPTVGDQMLATVTLTSTPAETPTSTAITVTTPRPNPGSIQPVQWTASVIRGVGLTVVLFMMLGLFVLSRKPKRKR